MSTLLERIAARTCRTCDRAAHPGLNDCRECTERRFFRVPEQPVSPWVQRMREGRGVVKEMTRAA